MGLLNSPRLSLGLKANGLSHMFFLYFLILTLSLTDTVHFSAFNYNDSETNISIYIFDLWLWFKVCRTFPLGCPQAAQIQRVQTHINNIFPPQDLINLLPLSLWKAQSSSQVESQKPGHSTYTSFLITIPTLLLLCCLFCHPNSKDTSKYPNTAYKAVHNLAVAYLGSSIFVFLSFWIFCASHFKPWKTIPYSFVSGSSYKLTKLPASLFPHRSLCPVNSYSFCKA